MITKLFAVAFVVCATVACALHGSSSPPTARWFPAMQWAPSAQAEVDRMLEFTRAHGLQFFNHGGLLRSCLLGSNREAHEGDVIYVTQKGVCRVANGPAPWVQWRRSSLIDAQDAPIVSLAEGSALGGIERDRLGGDWPTFLKPCRVLYTFRLSSGIRIVRFDCQQTEGMWVDVDPDNGHVIAVAIESAEGAR